MLCYLDFRLYLNANNPNRFHFLLKVLLPSQFVVKSTYRLLKQPLKTNQLKYDQSNCKALRKASLSVAWKPTMHLDVTLDDVKVDTIQTRRLIAKRIVRLACDPRGSHARCKFRQNYKLSRGMSLAIRL